MDPATGIRTVVATSGVAFNGPTHLSTDAFGNLFYIDEPSGTGLPDEVLEMPVTISGGGVYSARRIVTGPTFTGGNGTYYELGGVSVDPSQSTAISGGLPVAESLVFSDAGGDQTTSAIYRVATNNSTPTVLINNAKNTASGTATFDLPGATTVDTTGKIYYLEFHNFATGSTNDVNTLNYLTLSPFKDYIESSVQNIGTGTLDVTIMVPPPQPTLAAGTVTNNNTGTSATLNSNVTADGGVTNSGIIARGFVYAATAANATLKIGGTGATQVSSFTAASLPVAQNANLGTFSANLTGLTAGASYTFSAYAQNVSGYTYTAPVTFVTATAPSVTTSAASSPTGTSAVLNGNVTSAGGGSATLTTRGFVYSSTATTPAIGGTGVVNLVDSGTSTGAYSDTATGLANGTTYYYRAYAINQVGTTYGSVVNFTTIAPPTANNQPVNVAHDSAGTPITLTGSDPNNPAQSLTYAIAAYPAHGTLTSLNGSTGATTYVPATGYHGTDSFTFTATNTSNLTSGAATVTLTIGVGTPVANAQNVVASYNTNGSTNSTTITLTDTDDDTPVLTQAYTVLTAPSHGTLTGAAPNLTYTPTSDYTGTDSFTFRASNGTNTSNAATVSLTVVGQPYVTSFSPASGAVGSTVTLTGNNFLGMTGVTFFRNVAASTYTVQSDTQMTAVVPTGAKTGVITLTNGVGTNTTPTKFTVTP